MLQWRQVSHGQLLASQNVTLTPLSSVTIHIMPTTWPQNTSLWIESTSLSVCLSVWCLPSVKNRKFPQAQNINGNVAKCQDLKLKMRILCVIGVLCEASKGCCVTTASRMRRNVCVYYLTGVWSECLWIWFRHLFLRRLGWCFQYQLRIEQPLQTSTWHLRYDQCECC